MSGPNRYYWDSCVFIDWIKGESGSSLRDLSGTREVIELFEKNQAVIITSTITITEVTEAKIEPWGIKMFEDLLKRPGIQRVAVDVRIAKLARELRDHYSRNSEEFGRKTLTPPDAIHLATAILYKADEMHTFDKSNKKHLGLIPLSGKVGGMYPLVICEPKVKQGSLDFS
ncbi:MAG: PIN domain-containing protein [Gammaproteobacteria bacterium]|nr:MAG: PIN domain-containing protein [Gammaproteobacteria bacterium]